MMSGSESDNNHAQEEEERMEILPLDFKDDPESSSKSHSTYRSAMSTLSSAASSVQHHPLSPPIVATAADSDPLLQPPTYADVVLSSIKGDDDSSYPESNGLEESTNLPQTTDSPRSPSSSTEYLLITVSDPQKEVEASNSIVPGGNTYVTYAITTNTNISDYGGSDFSVRRRFRDVVTLSDRLSEAYRGFFIPPRPDKSIVESQVMQKQEFVEQRRVVLEKYLRRLAEHPMFKKSDELRVFLTVQGRMPLPTTVDVTSRMLDGATKLRKQLLGESTSVVEPQDAVQPAKGGRDLLRLFKELKQSVVNDWSGARPPIEEDDKEFLEKKETLHDLQLQLTTASKQAESLVKAQQDMGDTMGELGLAFLKLTKFENQQAASDTQKVRASDMKNVATAAVKVSRLYRELNAQTVKHLDTLHEYMGLMLGVQNAFSDRASALLTVQTLLSELSSLNSRAEKLETASSKIFGGDKSRIRKLEELKEATKATEDAKCCAVKEYERIKEHNKIEIERFDRQRHSEFVHMLKGFVTNQATYMEKIGNEWAKVAQETSKYANESL